MREHTVTLNSGFPMPLVGLGTYRSGPGEEARRAVRWALEAGYRLVDTSLAYDNEPDVSAAIRESRVERRDLFLTTKLENADQGYESALAACARSLENLRTDYLDLYLVHWPVPEHRGATWLALEELRRQGRCRSIGVSNYTVRHLEELLATARVVPAVNQVEFHPFLYQSDLLAYCRARGIVVEAYSPLVKATRLDHPVLTEVAEAYGKTPAQILVRWHVGHGVPAIPKSVHRDRIEENLAVWDFALSAADRARLDGLDEGLHVDWDPTDVP